MAKKQKSNLQVLMSAMNQDGRSLIKQANIKSDAIIINQCDKNALDNLRYYGNNIEFVSVDLRGVGSSRNHALMRATAKYCLFADEDIRYVEGYEELIISEFENMPNADMILFNVLSSNPNRPIYQIKTRKRIRRINCLRYGAVRIAAKTDVIKFHNLYFSLLFGGGARYSSGEDSLFIYSCIKAGMKLYSSPITIGTVKQDSSTWFNGYNDKFYVDKGVFFRYLFPVIYPIMIIQYSIRKYRVQRNKLSHIVYLMFKGAFTLSSETENPNE